MVKQGVVREKSARGAGEIGVLSAAIVKEDRLVLASNQRRAFLAVESTKSSMSGRTGEFSFSTWRKTKVAIIGTWRSAPALDRRNPRIDTLSFQ